jgi:hypothetical protein
MFTPLRIPAVEPFPNAVNSAQFAKHVAEVQNARDGSPIATSDSNVLKNCWTNA